MGVSLDQLTWDVEELISDGGLIDQLTALLPEPVTTAHSATQHQRVSGSPAPWHAEAAHVLMDIHAGARELEQELRYRITGRLRVRGGTDANTRYALAAVLRLVHAVPEPVADDAVLRVARWVRQARQVGDIDQCDRWVVLPRIPGMLPPPCPYCGLFTLRMSRTAGEVRCMQRECVDADGRRPVARMEYGRLSGDAYLAYADGREVVYQVPETPSVAA